MPWAPRANSRSATFMLPMVAAQSSAVAPHVVLASRLPAGERNGVHFVKDTAAALVRKIRAKPGKHIWLMGGGEIARDFLKADLVDELSMGVVPVLIGEGIPLFPAGFPQREFKLVENITYSKGLIALKYERVRKKRG
jgi:dihydrofolate reductase